MAQLIQGPLSSLVQNPTALRVLEDTASQREDFPKPGSKYTFAAEAADVGAYKGMVVLVMSAAAARDVSHLLHKACLQPSHGHPPFMRALSTTLFTTAKAVLP